MSFHQQSFSKRFNTMGDPAEAAFDAVYPKHHKLGLNRPPFFMGGMELAMRYTPDRMLRDRFVECMGVGRDRLLKLKDEKVEALQTWLKLGPTSLFVWDSHKKLWSEAPLDEWVWQVGAHGKAGMFENDGKSYHALHVENFPSDPQPLPEAPDADAARHFD